MFTDEVNIYVKAGDGGDGAVSFRREKNTPKGGPDGGDGGDGGNIILKASTSYRNLYHLSEKDQFHAEDGKDGGGKNKTGADGQDQVLPVPVGTIVRDQEHGHVLKDLSEEGETLPIAIGGRGGKGNARFATSTNQAPTKAENGEKGEDRTLTLELKLIAEVGLIGLPNAGKSTLLSALSAAHPKTAEYPFTTLYPVIGTVKTGDFNTMVMADLPGLIRGAHEGKGLGDRFLRHIERTEILIHVIDMSPTATTDPVEAYQIVWDELRSYSDLFEQRDEIIAANKIDVCDNLKNLQRLRTHVNVPVFPISAVAEEGLNQLLQKAKSLLSDDS